MRNHRVVMVDDSALPDYMDWVLAQDGDMNVVFIKESADLANAFCEVWTVFHRAVAVVPAPRPPEPRRRSVHWSLSGAGVLAAASAAAVGTGGLAAMEGFPLWSATGAAITSQWLQVLQF